MPGSSSIAASPDSTRPIDAAALFTQLTMVTGLSREKWEEILGCPPELQAAILANYRDQDWSTPGTSAFERIVALLEVVGTIAGVVGGVAGAAGALKALSG